MNTPRHFTEPLRIREVEFHNRLWMSPMNQYSAALDARPTQWHCIHYGSRAVGGVGLVMIESTAIGEQDRSTVGDLGIWNDEQVDAHRCLVEAIRHGGAVPGIQLQSAGRKASHRLPWDRSGQNSPLPPDDGGWTPAGPSALPFGKLTVPTELSAEEIDAVVDRFAAAARNAVAAGYDVVEIHVAHGYLLHQFLSPAANKRTDDYGGSLENRMRLTLRVAEAVRRALPSGKPLFARVTAMDWIEGGIEVSETVELARRLRVIGVDLLDVSSGGIEVDDAPPAQPALNLGFAERIRTEADIAVAPVGQIGETALLHQVFARSTVEAVFVGRPLLRDPYFALRVMEGEPREVWPRQYHRAF